MNYSKIKDLADQKKIKLTNTQNIAQFRTGNSPKRNLMSHKAIYGLSKFFARQAVPAKDDITPESPQHCTFFQ